MRLSLPVRRVLVATVAIAAATGCGGKPQRSVKAFCTRLRVEQNLLTTRLTDPAEVQPLVDRFRALDALAPEQIRDQWHDITTLVEKVATAELSPESQTSLTRLALATDNSVKEVTAYARDTCQVDLAAGPATTQATGV
jgi:type IV pilus biogenesis protein CpaD/CtpE